ncbi:hypothetical protein SAMN04488034_10919 [Salinimicrobium catena]|uniref:Uncharacterized protein n=1 Tax=Salinimicrobium catena TaxID=390640 RepID=A0A1H5P7H3_9FLAO|nr:hypothetical protein [Salinimicrobium catena]SDL72133.1 hypothetical protein SAMN04488140_10963 [Salinimicrobium catena]SEF08991.1 hypothetical protein SAMN04488034_10919 [Salinimicrobium catena]
MIPFFFLSTLTWGQETYTSPLTQYWPTLFTTEFKEVNRKIFFDPNSITIISETAEGKEIEIFHIQEVKIIEDTFTYFCLTKNKRKVTIAVPQQERVEIIDLYRLSLESGEEVQFRFHVD